MEQSLFVKTLGDSPKIRVMDMLITGRELDYSITDIAAQAGIGRATFYRLLDELLKNKIIIATRKIGKIQLYRINLENQNVMKIVELYDHMINSASEKKKARQENKSLKKKRILVSR